VDNTGAAVLPMLFQLLMPSPVVGCTTVENKAPSGINLDAASRLKMGGCPIVGWALAGNEGIAPKDFNMDRSISSRYAPSVSPSHTMCIAEGGDAKDAVLTLP
jgi:hypothetical protein